MSSKSQQNPVVLCHGSCRGSFFINELRKFPQQSTSFFCKDCFGKLENCVICQKSLSHWVTCQTPKGFTPDDNAPVDISSLKSALVIPGALIVCVQGHPTCASCFATIAGSSATGAIHCSFKGCYAPNFTHEDCKNLESQKATEVDAAYWSRRLAPNDESQKQVHPVDSREPSARPLVAVKSEKDDSDIEETQKQAGAVAIQVGIVPAEVSRGDRKNLGRKETLAEMQKQAGQVHSGDSPFTVNFQKDDSVTVNKLSVSVKGKQIFTDTTVKFSAGSRYGLMGPNGSGRSTLLRLINKREVPVPATLQVMLVEQEQEIDGGELTCVEAVLKSHKLLQLYENEAAQLYTVENPTDDQAKRLQWLENELMLMGANQQESKARKILSGLGFPADWQDRKTSSFSGGWRKRIALASAVFIEPDLLMLDEPTNHLDLNAVIWLEEYLAVQYNENQKRPKMLIVVSHDADFFDSVCTHMVHIENFRLHYYKGSFSQFESQLDQSRSEAEKNTKIQRQITQKKMEDHWSNAQVETWLKEQVQNGKGDREFMKKRKNGVVSFPFQDPPSVRDGSVISLQNVSFNYPGGPTLFQDVNCALTTSSRVCVVGPNGIGKSTLINLCTGALEPVTGVITLNRQVRIGRYTQHFMDSIPLEKTPVEYLDQLGLDDEFEARTHLRSFGLEGVCHHQMCASLSGGQKARVALASISAIVPHFIVFDEPTNHLDLESIEALCEAINDFKGGVLVVTHDARLIERTDMTLWIVERKNVKRFTGTLDDYKQRVLADHGIARNSNASEE